MPINKSLTDTIKIPRVKAEEARTSGKMRYPASLRKEIPAWLAVMRSEGVVWDNCKVALGIYKATLHAWHRDASEETPGSAMVRVKIRPENNSANSQPLRLVTPSGHQFTGFDLFLFVNKRRNRTKVLLFDGAGQGCLPQGFET